MVSCRDTLNLLQKTWSYCIYAVGCVYLQLPTNSQVANCNRDAWISSPPLWRSFQNQNVCMLCHQNNQNKRRLLEHEKSVKTVFDLRTKYDCQLDWKYKNSLPPAGTVSQFPFYFIRTSTLGMQLSTIYLFISILFDTVLDASLNCMEWNLSRSHFFFENAFLNLSSKLRASTHKCALALPYHLHFKLANFLDISEEPQLLNDPVELIRYMESRGILELLSCRGEDGWRLFWPHVRPVTSYWLKVGRARRTNLHSKASERCLTCFHLIILLHSFLCHIYVASVYFIESKGGSGWGDIPDGGRFRIYI